MHRSTNDAITALSLLGALGCALLAGCVQHDPTPVFRAGVFIDDRGISIPLPPPSLTDDPEQEVDIDGNIIGLDDLAAGLSAVVVDNVGGAEAEVLVVEGAATFHLEGLAIDLTNNCLELWLQTGEGQHGEHHTYTAVIDDTGEGVVAVEGCTESTAGAPERAAQLPSAAALHEPRR
ncbi:MAG: hypothetical protein K0V04_41200 [Deltaproteobacteria bacterium]|nr:hypothetical protein [Deltaproteobacteria bacterium]